MAETARYHVLRRIAHGGMAEIFLALQLGVEGFKKQVVLKRILPALAADPNFVRMLLDEAHIASTLNHSNLVQVLDLRHSGSEYFLVLEFVDGWSLEQVRYRAQKAKLKLPLPIALYIVGSLCRALAYVHTRTRDGRPLGIVHRDVNPQNILLSAEGEVKLVIKGKFSYMSPEQASGEDLDHRSDLFSVGTVLYLLTTGKKPFEGDSDLDVVLQVRKARYAKPSSLLREFNPDVERFIARALRANRTTRWQTAEQMADRIDAISSKLKQPTGPAALKRWLDALTARDGIKSAVHGAEETAAPPTYDGTVEVASGDLDLEVVTVGNDMPETVVKSDRARPRGTPTAAARVIPGPPNVVATEREDQHASMIRLPAGSAAERGAPSSAAVVVEPMPHSGLARWARKVAFRIFVLAVLVIGAGYFARPYLPPSLVLPMESWLRSLPKRISALVRSEHLQLGDRKEGHTNLGRPGQPQDPGMIPVDRPRAAVREELPVAGHDGGLENVSGALGR
jgi:serine/threonine protein kinase